MTAEEQAFHMGQAWEALPEPKRQFNFYVIGPDGEAKVFYIGPHAPILSPDDVQLVHRLWLNMRRDPSMQDLHHSDIITYALTRLAGQYAREKQEILRDLRNYRAGCGSGEREFQRPEASRCCLGGRRFQPRIAPAQAITLSIARTHGLAQQPSRLCPFRTYIVSPGAHAPP